MPKQEPRYAWKRTEHKTHTDWSLIDTTQPTAPYMAHISENHPSNAAYEVWGRLKGALESQRAASPQQAMARIHDQLHLNDADILGSLVGTASATPRS